VIARKIRSAAGGVLPGVKNFGESKGLSPSLVKRPDPIVRSDSRKRVLRLDGPDAAPKMATTRRVVGRRLSGPEAKKRGLDDIVSFHHRR
jgi:hypothetical protein